MTGSDIGKTTQQLDRRLRREHRVGRVVGALAMVAILLTLISVLASAAAARDPSGAGMLKVFRAHENRQLVAAVVRAVSVFLSIPLIWFLHSVLRARDPGVPPMLLTVGLLASATIAASTIIGWVGLQHAAVSYVDGAYRHRTQQAALHASTVLTVSRWLDVGSRLLFASWLAMTSLRANRTGLITPFLGTWGLLAAVTGTFLAVGDALYIGWLASVAMLSMGYWPGGRPRSWTSGFAEPWNAAAGSRPGRMST